jgi:maleylacetate reductase
MVNRVLKYPIFFSSALVAALDQPGSRRAVNIKPENFDEIAERAMTYGPVRMNPRPIKGPDEVKEILELAW